MMKKTFLLTIFTLICATAVFAQTSISVKVQNLVAADEQFNVTFIIEGEKTPSSFEWEPGNDFQLVWGPQKGTSTSISIVNGNSTRTSQTTYTYVLLPKRTGKFQLPVATATVKGKQITSKAISIEVVSNGGSGSGSAGSSSQSGNETATPGGNVSNDDLFLRLSLSKTTAMVGETITATLKLYQRVNIAGFEDARFPDFNGFWSQEVQAPTNIEFRRENIGDRIYNSAVLRSWKLIPQKAGDITINPAELVCLVNIRTPHASTGSIFDSFFQDDYQTIRKRVTSKAYTVQVQGLPAGAPASFAGGVGKFNMEASLTRDSLKTHDAASLIVTVTGTGNTTLLEAPKINFPPDFEVYDTKTTDVNGGKRFEYPFIPRSYGDFELGPVEYSYFDISSKKYVTLHSKPLKVYVAKGQGSETEKGGTLVQSNRKDVRDLGSDIRFISTDAASFAPVGAFFAGSTLFYVLTAVLIVLAFILYFAFRKMAARRADVAGSKNRSATKMARKRLSRAGAYLKDNLYTAFYEELHKTLLGFASDKLNMDASEMSKENIAARFTEKAVPEALTSEFVSLLDSCEFARYSPDAGHDAMSAHFESAVNVISSIDDSMKRKMKGLGGTAAALVLMLALPSQAGAADRVYPDSLWQAGVEAYSAGEWEKAAQSWEAIREAGLESSELYYNIGNAYFKAGDLSHAILGYERALKLDPTNDDAKFNLEFAQNDVQDNIEEIPEIFIEVIGHKMCRILPSDTWAVLFILLLAASLGLALLFLLGGTPRARKSGFICGIVSLVLCLLCLDFAFRQRTEYRSTDSAIVTSAVISVKSSPDAQNGKDLFVLHEGTKVRILNEVGAWKNIELADGRQGWLNESDIEII